MEYRNIPGTDLSVSLLGFGNFTFGTNWWGEFTDADATRIQNFAFDQGVNFFDTAPAYGNGVAEERMIETIAYAGRDNLVLSTKFGYDFYSDPGEEGVHRERKQDFSPAFIRADLERSLKRMKVEAIDLYQAHNIKLPHYQDEVFEVLETLEREGKIRAWGIAVGPAIGWREECHQAFTEHDAAVVQTVFNLYEQDPGRECCEIAAHRGKGGVIARVPTNSGILDEEFDSADHRFDANDHRKFRDRNWLIYGLKKNDMIRPMAKRLGLGVRQFAFKWLASQAGLVSIEPNILSESDVTDFAQACEDTQLPADMLATLSAWYADDFGLGADAHACDFKSSTASGGSEPSSYQAPVLA